MIFSGDDDETEVRMFEDDQRKIFRRGATDSFLMAVPRLDTFSNVTTRNSYYKHITSVVVFVFPERVTTSTFAAYLQLSFM